MSMWIAAVCVAVALPTLLAFSLPPSATFLNQAVSLIGWGGLLAVIAMRPRARTPALNADLSALLGALALLGAASLAAPLWAALPWALSLSTLGLVAATLLVVTTGAALSSELCGRVWCAFCVALAIAGVLSTAIGIVQVFAPGWADGNWIAASALPGRASGNLRQPNHLSSLLLWSMIAAAWLAESGALRRGVAAALGALFLFGIVLTASRTGIVGVIMLALWGVLDRRLSRSTRIALVITPLLYLLFWLGLTAWAHESHQVFAGETHIAAESDISSSRFKIWSDTLSLIAQHPWLGVGFGEFNFAWSLTPFPHRPVAFFDHTHNLPLQFAVELGLPLATLVLALLTYALWRAYAAGRDASGPRASLLRAAFMMVLMMAVHSQLEYPLWYAYFLLPTAFAFGLCLGGGAPRFSVRPLAFAATLMLAGSLLSVLDYLRVVVIFAPPAEAAPLAERIASGQRSVFFAHHADYAAATTAEHPSDAMPSFKVATHYLLDTRLMMAWATALNEAGDVERARHIAQRLREFHNEDSKPFFEPCDDPKPAEPLPFQCTPPSRAMDYRDFR
jgi:O-antigen ligase